MIFLKRMVTRKRIKINIEMKRPRERQDAGSFPLQGDALRIEIEEGKNAVRFGRRALFFRHQPFQNFGGQPCRNSGQTFPETPKEH
jgi:hypothetical protein